LSKLIILNNNLLRILQNKTIKHIIVNCIKNTYTIPLRLLHQYQILVFMHQYVHRRNKLPVVFSAYFDENKTLHDHDTRQKQDFHTYSTHSEFGERAIKHKGVNYGMIYQMILKIIGKEIPDLL